MKTAARMGASGLIICKITLIDGRELFLKATDLTRDELTTVILDSSKDGWLALDTFRDGTMIIAIRDISTFEIEEAPLV